jgi:hypothetical protein
MTNKLTQWLTIGSNIAVLAGLLLVAVQIYQNTEITKAQLANDYFLMDMELELKMMGESPIDSWVKAVYSPDEITPTDAAVLDRYFNFGMVQINRLQSMQSLGLADQDQVRDRIGYLRWHLGNEVGSRWWELHKQNLPATFVEQVEGLVLSGSAFDSNKTQLDAMLE